MVRISAAVNIKDCRIFYIGTIKSGGLFIIVPVRWETALDFDDINVNSIYPTYSDIIMRS